jgi:hypothetical protein
MTLVLTSGFGAQKVDGSQKNTNNKINTKQTDINFMGDRMLYSISNEQKRSIIVIGYLLSVIRITPITDNNESSKNSIRCYMSFGVMT